MTGVTDLNELLKSMSPEIQTGEFVFSSIDGKLMDYIHLNPLATFTEAEGLTLIIDVNTAKKEKIDFESTYKQITLTIHSSLDAVGLTAAIATKLTNKNISANVVAAYYHDHIFVQTEKAEAALLALQEFAN